MKSFKRSYYIVFILSTLLLTACEDLTELNQNPNGVEPSTVNPNLVISTVMTSFGKDVVTTGYNGGVAGVVQQLQKDSWSGGFNNYKWDESDWSTYYSMLRNNKLAYNRSVELGLEFHQGVCLVMKSMIYAKITDFWGDAPYTNAVKGDEGSEEYLKPAYDSQEVIYKGIIEDLKTAAALLSKDQGEYSMINEDADIYYNGDPAKWQKLANSLALRYYMRLSEKLPDYAKAGVEEMLSKPLISSVDESCTMAYIGSSGEDSWPANTEQDASGSDFNGLKPCTTLLYKLQSLNDPRIDVWFKPVQIPIKVSGQYDEKDIIVDGVRYLNVDSLDAGMKIFDPETYKADKDAGYTLIDTNSVYVGIPPSVVGGEPYHYNLNPNPTQGGTNVHVSYLDDIFKSADGELLKSRIMTYAEVCFLKAEAAIRGWGSDAEGNYNKGVEASLEAWNVGDEYNDYIENEGVAFDGSLSQVMEQKWIASFTSASEAWFDWRRTGYPAFETGPAPERDRLPLRYYYGNDEKNINGDNYQAAISNLEETNFSLQDGKDSPWSKMWVLQGTGNPW